jgi:hypothetical protein
MTDHDPYCRWPSVPCACADFTAARAEVRADEQEKKMAAADIAFLDAVRAREELTSIRDQIADEVEVYRRALPDAIPSYYGTIRNSDDMSWALAQIRDRIRTPEASPPWTMDDPVTDTKSELVAAAQERLDQFGGGALAVWVLEEIIAAVEPMILAGERDRTIRGLYREAERARTSPHGHHPELQFWTDAATIRLMARKIERGEL